MLAKADNSIRRKQKRQRARNPRARRRGFTIGHGQGFRREGSRKRSPVSMDCWTVEWIDPASLRTRIFQATGEPLPGEPHPRSIRKGRVSLGFRVRRRLLCGLRACSSGRGNGWRWLAWQGVVSGSNKPDDQQNGRAPVGTCPVGLHHASLRAACGRGGIKGSVPNKGENRVFVRGVHTLVFEGFIGTDAVGVGIGFLRFGFHGFIGRQSPGGPHGFPWGHPEDSGHGLNKMPTALTVGRNKYRSDSVAGSGAT